MLGLDLSSHEKYYQLNENLRSLWPHPLGDCELRLYQSVEHALAELTQSLAQMFLHRNEVFYFKGLSPFYRHPMLLAARRGLMVHAGSFADLQNATFLAERLSKTSLLVAYNLDDPLTGRLFDGGLVERQLAGKNVFRIRICHSPHFLVQAPESVGSHQAQIYSLPGIGAVGLLGKSVRGAATIAPFLKWPQTLPHKLNLPRPFSDGDRDLIAGFEKSLPAGATPILGGMQGRLWDRGVLSWPELDGEAIMSALAEERGWQLEEPGREERLETSSLCRWGSLDFTSWLEHQGWDKPHRRGLVVFARELLEDPQLIPQLESVVERLCAAQTVVI